jgi:hypothetical protein
MEKYKSWVFSKMEKYCSILEKYFPKWRKISIFHFGKIKLPY